MNAEPKIELSTVGPVKKAMISQPMAGKTAKEIAATRKKAVAAIGNMGYQFVNTYFEEYAPAEEKNAPLRFLAKALTEMSRCDAVYFCEGWGDSRGCRIEHAAALEYGLEIIYEDDGRTASDASK